MSLIGLMAWPAGHGCRDPLRENYSVAEMVPSRRSRDGAWPAVHAHRVETTPGVGRAGE
jgi:hypothetical protein